MATLYRKYRPQKLSEIVGQEAITTTLLKQLESGNISHAYIFSGPRGTGKTSTARIVAKALNCDVYRLQTTDNSKGKSSGQKSVEGGQAFGEPCGRCESCVAI